MRGMRHHSRGPRPAAGRAVKGRALACPAEEVTSELRTEQRGGDGLKRPGSRTFCVEAEACFGDGGHRGTAAGLGHARGVAGSVERSVASVAVPPPSQAQLWSRLSPET